MVSHGEKRIDENLERLGLEVVMAVSEPEGASEQKLCGEVMMSIHAVTRLVGRRMYQVENVLP